MSAKTSLSISHFCTCRSLYLIPSLSLRLSLSLSIFRLCEERACLPTEIHGKLTIIFEDVSNSSRALFLAFGNVCLFVFLRNNNGGQHNYGKDSGAYKGGGGGSPLPMNSQVSFQNQRHACKRISPACAYETSYLLAFAIAWLLATRTVPSDLQPREGQ